LTRCEEFFTKLEQLKAEGDEAKLREFCNKSYDMMQKLDSHITFMKKVITDDNSTIVESPAVIPEGATRLIRSQSQEIQDQVIPKIKETLQKGEKVTAPQVKQWVDEANPEFCSIPETVLKDTEVIIECPICNSKHLLIHIEPSGAHSLREVIE